MTNPRGISGYDDRRRHPVRVLGRRQGAQCAAPSWAPAAWWPATTRGLSAELRYKRLGSRYGTEDRSPRLRSYGVWSVGARYRWRQLELSVNVENLFNSRWESAEFFYASRLRGEPAVGFEDFHFVPGYPRHVRAGIAYYSGPVGAPSPAAGAPAAQPPGLGTGRARSTARSPGSRITTSTRRFRCLPSAVSFETTG
jgi:hypothetical protein